MHLCSKYTSPKVKDEFIRLRKMSPLNMDSARLLKTKQNLVATAFYGDTFRCKSVAS